MTNLRNFSTELERVFDVFSQRSIGYEYLPDLFQDWGTKMPGVGGFPPYDIEKTGKNKYALTLALAGYSPKDVEITMEDNRLFVKTRQPEKTLTKVGAKSESVLENFLYKGIAKRSFNLSYALGEHMNVHDATFENGLLTIHLERIVPEEKKPRMIPIIGHEEIPKLEEVKAA